MQRRKKKKYYSKTRFMKLNSNKYINKRKTCYLEIQVPESKASEWEVVRITSPFKTPNSLINSKILVTDGKKVVRGTIVKASIVGGGATSPATGDGLPPVDE